ncbi:hypothetical protein BDV06DRAFT_191548 [Aspergillus oleicola]
MPSFVALQVYVPIAQLDRYGDFQKDERTNTTDAYPLAQILMRAFLQGRATGPEAWFLDRDVPPFTSTLGTHIFGRKEFGAFMLGIWCLKRQAPFSPPALPAESPPPPSEFPSNEDIISRATATHDTDAAGTVIYWTFPRSLVNAVNRLSVNGLSWRLMDGGFQEFIVEKLSDETARVTYVTLECSNLYPDSGSLESGSREMDFRKLPWCFHEMFCMRRFWYGELCDSFD